VKRRLLMALTLLLAAGFIALGIWQVERRAWKHELIAAVDARIHRAPVAAPGPAEWPRLSADRDAYRRIVATGRFRHDRETLVQAVTERARAIGCSPRSRRRTLPSLSIAASCRGAGAMHPRALRAIRREA